MSRQIGEFITLICKQKKKASLLSTALQRLEAE